MSLEVAYLLESTALSGGVKVALLQAEALARRGHRVTVVSPEPRPEWFPLSRARFERSAFRDSAELPRAGVRVATFWTTVAPALEGARGPVFHLCQGYEGDFSFYAGQRGAIEEAYRQPARKLVISETLRGRLAEKGFGPATNVGQAFDRSGFSPAAERPPEDPPVVLVVGAWEADVKGIAIALAGLALWRRRGGRFRLRRISPFPAREDERASGLVDEYHHALAPERMPFAYRASDVFVGPSRREAGLCITVGGGRCKASATHPAPGGSWTAAGADPWTAAGAGLWTAAGADPFGVCPRNFLRSGKRPRRSRRGASASTPKPHSGR